MVLSKELYGFLSHIAKKTSKDKREYIDEISVRLYKVKKSS